ncbi:MAG: CtsR family transcriptional regulator [Clostridiaceae bacterium]|nr:CtsR family transcriptional regulator [Clostridiaceae bacterium]
MSKISDAIEAILKQMLDENEGIAEFTRNELAEKMNCVPSQITYVLQTRFTNGMGYLKESKRGGGGSITIRRVEFSSPKQQLAQQIQSVPKSLSQQKAYLILDNLSEQEVIDERISKIVKSAVSHQALHKVPNLIVDQVRSDVFVNILLVLYQQKYAGGKN